MAVTRSKSYAPALYGPLKHHRKHTARYAAKLQAHTEEAATKRLQGEQAEYERLVKGHAAADTIKKAYKQYKTSKAGRRPTRGRKTRYTRRR
jgi:hypothetical protein